MAKADENPRQQRGGSVGSPLGHSGVLKHAVLSRGMPRAVPRPRSLRLGMRGFDSVLIQLQVLSQKGKW